MDNNYYPFLHDYSHSLSEKCCNHSPRFLLFICCIPIVIYFHRVILHLWGSEGCSPGKIFELWVPPAAGAERSASGVVKPRRMSCFNCYVFRILSTLYICSPRGSCFWLCTPACLPACMPACLPPPPAASSSQLTHTPLAHTQLLLTTYSHTHTTYWRTTRRGTSPHRTSLGVAGVALGDIDLHFAWWAWHLWHCAGSGGTLGSHLTLLSPRLFEWQASYLETSTFTLCGRRGTCGTELLLVLLFSEYFAW